jgi:Rad3-related DNA helicase
MSTDRFNDRFGSAFPAPEPRKHQKKAIRLLDNGIKDEDIDVLILDAPPGFGKSITLETALEMQSGSSYYLTPLKSLQDQLTEDDLVGERLIQIKGRANYECVLDDPDTGDTVDKGKCQKRDDFECPKKDVCPYYVKKARAKDKKKAVMNLAYFLNVPVTADPEDGQFSPRQTMVIDECQSLDDWVLSQIQLTISKRSLPTDVWRNIDLPDKSDCEDVDFMVKWLQDELIDSLEEFIMRVSSAPMMTESQLSQLEDAKDVKDRLGRFITDIQDNHWIAEYDAGLNKNRANSPKAVFKPVKVGRFLDSIVWNKAETVILSSATVPKGGWLEEVGLGDANVRRLNIPSEFPVENRPIVTSESVGKMNYSNRQENMPDAVEKVAQIAQHHDGEKGLVHCRGYNYIDMFRKACFSSGHGDWFRNNVAIQDRENREESLASWLTSDKQVFLSVNMSEGIDLKGDKCRWQVVLKAKFPSLGDKRVDYRLNEMDDQEWYSQKAVIALEQAYGRAVRSPEDEAVMYILDSSAVNLMRYNTDLFHDWFLEGVNGL